MVYLKQFEFPTAEAESHFFDDERRTCYDTFYPFQVLSKKGFSHIELEPVTILYGGNGSGKTTALNVIAEKLECQREAIYNKSSFFPDYVRLCCAVLKKQPADSRIITSDDVFDYMLNIRSLNEGIDLRREEVFGEYLEDKYAGFQMRSLEDYEALKRVNHSRRKSQSQYTRGRLMSNVRERSNGESAFYYFTEKISENSLYLLDEPENSLAPQRQLELADYIENSARFFGCQFVISTHSPFLLAMRGAKIYDLDAAPVRVREWTELENVRVYRDFFLKHAGEFAE